MFADSVLGTSLKANLLANLCAGEMVGCPFDGVWIFGGGFGSFVGVGFGFFYLLSVWFYL